MKLKMLTSIAGVDFSLTVGEVTERFDATEGARLIAAGFAEAMTAPKATAKRAGKTVETASVKSDATERR